MKKLISVFLRNNRQLVTLYLGTNSNNYGSYLVNSDGGILRRYGTLELALEDFCARLDAGAGSMEVFTRLAKIAEGVEV